MRIYILIVIQAIILPWIGVGCRSLDPPTLSKENAFDRCSFYNKHIALETEFKDGVNLSKEYKNNCLKSWRLDYFANGGPRLAVVGNQFSVVEYHFDNIGVTVTSYDPWRQKAAEYFYDGNTFNGTVWSQIFGARGLKSSTLSTIKNNVLIKEEPYKQEELEAFFQ